MYNIHRTFLNEIRFHGYIRISAFYEVYLLLLALFKFRGGLLERGANLIGGLKRELMILSMSFEGALGLSLKLFFTRLFQKIRMILAYSNIYLIEFQTRFCCT